jgi:hypothetical protein
LEIEGVTIAGLRLRATAIKNRPDASVTFQLEYQRPKFPGSALSRVEWRPAGGAHNNRGLGPPEHRNKFITGTHYHPFDLNWQDAASQVGRGNLPIAIPLVPEPEDFAVLVAFVAQEFRIPNANIVSEPPWEADFFEGGP